MMSAPLCVAVLAGKQPGAGAKIFYLWVVWNKICIEASENERNVHLHHH